MKPKLTSLFLMLTVIVAFSLPAFTEAGNKKCGKHKDFCPELPVQTVYGPVQGAAMGSKNDIENPPVYAWTRIPYAKPPVGDLMFKAPQDPEPWSEVKDCTQYDITYDDYPVQWDWAYFTDEKKVIGNIDSLYLNVWRPQTNKTKLPVQVDIHGGSACNWSGLEANEWQAYVNKANVIVVAPNYRLGPWGLFYNTSLNTGDPEDDSGNFALLDQIKVLKWVKDNIAAFGGDPDNVTLSGQSSGGLHAVLLLHSPLAKDLFHKAIVSSPSMGSRLEKTVEDGQQASEQLLVNLLFYDETTNLTEEEALQAAEAMSDSDKAAYFRDKFTNDPKLVFTAINYGTPNRPSRSPLFIWGFVDGHVISPTIDWDPAGGNYFPKPMIIGDTKSERGRGSAKSACGGSALSSAHYAFLYGGPFDYASCDEAIADLVAIVADPDNPQEAERTQGGWFNWSVEDFKAKFEIVSAVRSRAFDTVIQNAARSAVAARELKDKIFIYRHDWAAGSDEPGYDDGIPFSECYHFNLGAQHSDDLAFMYDWNDIIGPDWFDTWTRVFAFNDDNYEGRKGLAEAVGSYLEAFLHSKNGKMKKIKPINKKKYDKPVQWKPWTDKSEQIMTWNADKTKAMIAMNSTEVFTEETLKTYFESSIDNLPEATSEDKSALKLWCAEALKADGFTSWCSELGCD